MRNKPLPCHSGLAPGRIDGSLQLQEKDINTGIYKSYQSKTFINICHDIKHSNVLITLAVLSSIFAILFLASPYFYPPNTILRYFILTSIASSLTALNLLAKANRAYNEYIATKSFMARLKLSIYSHFLKIFLNEIIRIVLDSNLLLQAKAHSPSREMFHSRPVMPAPLSAIPAVLPCAP